MASYSIFILIATPSREEPMHTLSRTTAALAAVVVLAGCGVKGGPGWSFIPGGQNPGPSQSSTAAASSASPPATTATPSATPAAAAGDSVLPALTPKSQLPPTPADEVNTSYAPNVPPAATRTEQAIVSVHFDVVEGVKAIDASGHQYLTWGYRVDGDTAVTTGTPGPMIRARVGDVLRFTLTNDGTMPHNVDFHAVTGQGGGAKDLTVAPGATATIEARLLYPGLFLYHCAAGDVPDHIAQGMYGGILVDPATPLPAVQHELYVVQSEFYTTTGADGTTLTTNRQAITDENPTYVVFNGAVGSLTADNAPHMQVGQTVRIYFVDAGPNLPSNFHPIGSHWDRVWVDGATLNPPLRGVQTTLVPAGGAVIVDLIGQVPQTVLLVDHAIERTFDKGALGQIIIDGDPNPELFEAFPAGGSPAPTVTPPASASPTPAGTIGGLAEQVSIVAGSATYQPNDAPDEFAASENPPDYSINYLTVPLGATVTWTDDDPGVPHTVTAVDGSFDSGLIQSGASYSHTFTSPGVFEYFCTLHPWMRAKVEVVAP
jgi:nitrite reductase (NO-forming)